jgi:hypothetical protein
VVSQSSPPSLTFRTTLLQRRMPSPLSLLRYLPHTYDLSRERGVFECHRHSSSSGLLRAKRRIQKNRREDESATACVTPGTEPQGAAVPQCMGPAAGIVRDRDPRYNSVIPKIFQSKKCATQNAEALDLPGTHSYWFTYDTPCQRPQPKTYSICRQPGSL